MKTTALIAIAKEKNLKAPDLSEKGLKDFNMTSKDTIQSGTITKILLIKKNLLMLNITLEHY
jgi:hypothetical protein